MGRTFNGSSDVLKASIPTGGNVGFGTFVVIMRQTSFAATVAQMRLATSTPTNVLGMFTDATAKVGMSNAASAPVGSTTLSTNTWYCVGVGKATGSSTPRVHIYNYGTNAFTHENTGSAITDATAPGTTGRVCIGARAADQFFPGDIAVAGFWARNLTDGEFEELPFTLLAWITSAPTGLWMLDQADTGQAVPDLTGNGGNQASLTGTSVSSNSVPVFNIGDGPWLATRPQAAGGTIQNLTVDGTVTPSGALTRLVSKSFSGGLTPSGISVRTAAKVFAGTVTSVGVLTRTAVKVMAGGLTPAGALVKRVNLARGGGLTPSGAVTKTASKLLAGAVTSAGALINTSTRFIALAGSMTPTGALVKTASRSLAGGLTPMGGLVKRVGKLLGGVITSAGALLASLVSGGPSSTQTAATLTLSDQPVVMLTLVERARASCTVSDRATATVTLADRIAA